MALTPGTRLGVYEVTAQIGEGGMGQVYRAWDTTLHRDVALKILPDAFATDKDRLARFTREAQTLAALNHPHIAHIHGLEDFAGVRALVMELVQGEDLSQRLSRGAIGVGDALPMARQIAEALEAAHEQGIIHRDLKPANIKVRDDGTVKVLDFGLAKGVDPAGTASASVTLSPTITSPAMTEAGVLLGTAAYMSPEQAKGRAADRRSDVWAFGAVVYEMLTGQRPFKGEDVSETLAFILTREPDWTLLPADTPPAIRRLLRRCLEKNPRRRLQAVAEARIQIDDLSSGSSDENVPLANVAASSGWRRALPLAGVGLLAAMAGAVGTWMTVRSPAASMPVTRFSLVLPDSQALAVSINDRDVAFSSDGGHLAYTAGAQSQLMVHALDQLDAQPLAGIANARAPLFSPDGRWIAFFNQLEEGFTGDLRRGQLKKVAIAGGSPIMLCEVTGGSRGASWAPDSTIVFATNDPATGLLRVPAAGGEPTVLTSPDRAKGEQDHFYPSVLPGGGSVLFSISYDDRSPPTQHVAVLDLKSGGYKILVREGSQPAYAESGHLLYVVAGSLWAVRFNLATLDVVGDPTPIVEQVMTTGAANFSVSPSGALVYVRPTAQRGGDRSFVWVSRKGESAPITAPPRRYDYPRLSPDNTQVLVRISDQYTGLWTWDLALERFTRVTPPEGSSYSPAIWSPDGRNVLYTQRLKDWTMFRRRSDGTGAEERLTSSSLFFMPTSISPDGSRLVYQGYLTPDADHDLMMRPLNGTAQPEPLVQTPADERNAVLSPDGRWLAYESNQTRRFQIHVRPFPNVADGEYQVSTDGGRTPLWGPNGGALYLANGASLMSVAIQTTPSFRAAKPERLFEDRSLLLDARTFTTGAHRTYDISRDGQRFLVMKSSAPSSINTAPPSMVVVRNWFEELKRLLPTP